MKQISMLWSVVLLILLSSCGKTKNEVVIYTSVDQVFSEPILKDFEQKTGIKVKAVYDTEETKSTGVLNRLLAEKNNPQADVFWSGDPIRTIVLKQRGVTASYHSALAQDISPIFKDSEGHWTGFSARARVLIYNKKLLADDDVPKSIFDLGNEKYKGKVAIANPLFGTTTFQFAALFSSLGDERAKLFLSNLKKNKVVIATSNGDVKKRVVKGEIACGLTDTDDAHEAIQEGANVGVVFLDQVGLGSLIMPNTVNLIHRAPNEANGKKLIDYLLSSKTEAQLAKSCAQMPLHKNVLIPKDVPSLDAIVPMQINYEETANKLQEIQNYLKLWVEN